MLKIRKVWLWGVTLALAMVFLVAACGGDEVVVPGVTDDEILLGTHTSLTGPIAVYSQIANTTKAYFDFINETKGGVNGRKIKYILEDDAYSPPKTVDLVRKLVEQDQIFALVNGLGTPTHLQVVDYLRERGVPDLFVGTGAIEWVKDPAARPNIFGSIANYVAEGVILGQYVAENFAGQKLGLMRQKEVTVSGTEAVRNFDAVLKTGASISGRVTDSETGLPVNITIALRNVISNRPTVHVETNAQGRYAMTGVAPGTYRIQQCCEGQEYVLEYYDNRLVRNEADLIVIEGSEILEGYDIEATRRVTVSGRIRDGGANLPISGMRVCAGLAAWPYLRFAYTDSQDEYILRGVPSGSIVIQVDGQGYVEQCRAITVTDGQDVTGVDF